MCKPYRKLKGREVLAVASACIESGHWVLHEHAKSRARQRSILIGDIEEVLVTGTPGEPYWKPGGNPPKCWWYKMTALIKGQTVTVVFYVMEMGAEPYTVVYTVFADGI